MTYYKNCQQNKSKCRQLLEFICWGFRVHMNEDKLLLCSISFKCVSTFFCMNSSWMSNVYVYSVQFYYVFIQYLIYFLYSTLPSVVLYRQADHIIQGQNCWQISWGFNFLCNWVGSQLGSFWVIYSFLDGKVSSSPNFRHKETRDQFVD